MKILFIIDNFPPEVNAPATKTYEHVLEWQKQGIQVSIITCTPNFPHDDLGSQYSSYDLAITRYKYLNMLNNN